MTEALRVVDATVHLGGRDIFCGLNATVARGEFLGVFGPNGAGKSTLLRAILGLCPLASGRIEVLGLPPVGARHKIGYMPQAGRTPEGIGLSAREMVRAALHGTRPGLPVCGRAGHREVDRALELVGASSYARRPFGVLSGGEKQRVALAQALLGEPEMLLLDEPLASLDPKNQNRLVDCVAGIRRETRTTIVFVAHDLNPLLPVMDRALYLAGGGGLIGPVDEVVTGEKLSALYQTEIEVVRANGRVFILHAAENTLEAARHG